MTRKCRPLKWLVLCIRCISVLVFMATVFGSLNYARLGIAEQFVFSIIEEYQTVGSNPVFDTAKQAVSLAIGAGFLGAFAEIACLLMLYSPISILITFPMVAGTLTMYRFSFVKISSLVPTVYSDCSRPDRWPKTNGLDLFSVYGGNLTALLAPESGCESLKLVEYWGSAGSAAVYFWFGVTFIIAFIFPPAYSTVVVLYRVTRRRYRHRNTTSMSTLSDSYPLKNVSRPSKASQTPFVTFFANPKLSPLVITHLHHSSLLSLRLTHPTLTAAFPIRTTAGLRQTTCGERKGSCVICRTQICDGCVSKREQLPSRKEASHFENCMPYCAWCAWKWKVSKHWNHVTRAKFPCDGHSVQLDDQNQERIEKEKSDKIKSDEKRKRNEEKKKKKEAKKNKNNEADETQTPNTETSDDIETGPSPSEGAARRFFEVCKSCLAMDDTTLLALYDRREIEAMKALSYRLSCEVCSTPVGGNRGACWWVCKMCTVACQWEGHVEIENG